MAVLGIRFCARAFSSCGEREPLFIAVRGPLTIAASLVAEHRLQTRRLSSCGPRAELLRGMWDLPRPGLEPVSSALAGRPSTTAPPGKPSLVILSKVLNCSEPGSAPQGCCEHQVSLCEALKIRRTAHRLVIITGLDQCEPDPVYADGTVGLHSACTSLSQLGCRLPQGKDTG